MPYYKNFPVRMLCSCCTTTITKGTKYKILERHAGESKTEGLQDSRATDEVRVRDMQTVQKDLIFKAVMEFSISIGIPKWTALARPN